MDSDNNKIRTLTENHPVPDKFLIIILALMSSFGPMSMDILLPTLPSIQNSYDISTLSLQQVVTCFFFGMFFGEVLIGPLSDRYGRKPLIMLSSCIFLLGSLLCISAPTYKILILGRIIQGFGSAGPKIVIRAMLRDMYSGSQLAQVLSMMYTLFIFIPMIAPLVGQGLDQIWGWQGIFYFLFVFAAASTIAFGITQQETIRTNSQHVLSAMAMIRISFKIMAHQRVFLLKLILGFLFGIKLTYLSNAQQTFENFYGVTHLFPVYFAILATAIGLAFLLNTRLVMILGAARVCGYALIWLLIITCIMAISSYVYHGIPPFVLFIATLYGMFFSFGLLWGNLSALAMDYLGEVAGVGSTLIASSSTLVSIIIATGIGYLTDDTFTPIAFSFAAIALISLLCFYAAINSQHQHNVLR